VIVGVEHWIGELASRHVRLLEVAYG
jgi:hypothetical protein